MIRTTLAGVLCAALTFFATAASANYFAFTPIAEAPPTFSWSPDGSGGGVFETVAPQQVEFTFLPNSPPVLAIFTLSAAFNSSGSGSGSFSLIYDGPATPSLIPGMNLVSGTFAGGGFMIRDIKIPRGQFAAAAGSGSPNALDFSSDLPGMDAHFDRYADRWHMIRFKFDDIEPDVAGGQGLPQQAFTASFTRGLVSGAIPEPATWAMMVIGFGAVGFALRASSPSRRRMAHR